MVSWWMGWRVFF